MFFKCDGRQRDLHGLTHFLPTGRALGVEWEEADVGLASVSRSSKTPSSIYLANRGYKVANIPLIPESPPPDVLFRLKNPLIVGLTTSPDRLVQEIGRASGRERVCQYV